MQCPKGRAREEQGALQELREAARPEVPKGGPAGHCGTVDRVSKTIKQNSWREEEMINKELFKSQRLGVSSEHRRLGDENQTHSEKLLLIF